MPFRAKLNEIFRGVKDQIERYENETRPPHPTTAQPPYQYQRPPPPPPPQQPLIPNPIPRAYWQPGFDISIPVSTYFKHQTGAGGWGNNELQTYTSFLANSFFTQDCKLVLRAISNSHSPDPSQRYTSARLTSHQILGRQCGCLYTWLSPPIARGIWPAFWLLPAEPFTWPHEGEVDLMETWNADQTNHSCLHWGFFTGEDAQKHRVVETPMNFLSHGPHQFGFAWNQPESGVGGKLLWYIDGRAVMRANIPSGTRRISDWQIIINVAMGGNVCQGMAPDDGMYDFVVHEMKLCEEPAGGWDMFEREWKITTEGHGM